MEGVLGGVMLEDGVPDGVLEVVGVLVDDGDARKDKDELGDQEIVGVRDADGGMSPGLRKKGGGVV